MNLANSDLSSLGSYQRSMLRGSDGKLHGAAVCSWNYRSEVM